MDEEKDEVLFEVAEFCHSSCRQRMWLFFSMYV